MIIFLFFEKVPGRMGMIVTLYLISTNVYNSVDAPRARGFSYIEIWMIGAQIPILLALCEYGFVLYLKKVLKNSDDDLNAMTDQNGSIPTLDDKIKKLDFSVMILSFFYFITFASMFCAFAHI